MITCHASCKWKQTFQKGLPLVCTAGDPADCQSGTSKQASQQKRSSQSRMQLLGNLPTCSGNLLWKKV